MGRSGVRVDTGVDTGLDISKHKLFIPQIIHIFVLEEKSYCNVLAVFL